MKLLMVQPSLTHYRVPVYRELAARPGVDLMVWHAQGVGDQNVEPDGFDAELRPMKRGRLFGQPWYWHPAQLDAATADYDVVMFNWDIHYLSLIPALRKAKRNGVGTVLWGHGTSRRDAGFAGKPKRWLAKLADALLLYTPATAEVYQQRGFTNAFAAPNTIDTSAIDAVRRDDKEAAKRELGLTGKVALHVSRLVPERRVDVLLHALVFDHGREWTAVIVGDGPAKPELLELARKLDLGGRVRFVEPLFDVADLAPWYAAAEAFVMPAFGGLGVLSALAFGVPVVADGRAELHGPEIAAVEDGVNGLFIDRLVPSDLMVKLNRLPDATLAANALRTMREKFSIPSMIDGMLEAARFAANRVAEQRS
ncbi:MAG: glycosyltransferase [Planctomycetota bacterium]